ncbi:MAG: hypothetical protein AB7K24_27110 [Gemmataceae bacterium]
MSAKVAAINLVGVKAPTLPARIAGRKFSGASEKVYSSSLAQHVQAKRLDRFSFLQTGLKKMAWAVLVPNSD